MAIDKFAVENETHLWRGCACDWIRALDFVPHPEEKCRLAEPFTIDKNLVVLRTPNGAWNPEDSARTHQGNEPDQPQSWRPLLVHVQEQARPAGSSMEDYLDRHWDRFNGLTCEYCDGLKISKNFSVRRYRGVEPIRSLCLQVYRPLKKAMQDRLELVRSVPLNRRLRMKSRYHDRFRFEGLAAGITTTERVLCGIYLVISCTSRTEIYSGGSFGKLK